MKLASILPLFLICILIAPTAFSQAGDQTINLHNEEIANYRAAKNQLMTDSLNSPLNADQIKKFDGLSYFPVDIQYRLDGRFMPDESRSEVSLNTTSGSKINLIKVGTVTFSLEGKSYSFMVFQNKNLPEFDDRSQQLFIPFADLSNGKNTNP
ncbi:MAG: DUF1684 domain-containing protein, partial [Bacteroidales bacterium]|nr:DUF1684 domain-containing protein [Bacteroidales bacterium]